MTTALRAQTEKSESAGNQNMTERSQLAAAVSLRPAPLFRALARRHG